MLSRSLVDGTTRLLRLEDFVGDAIGDVVLFDVVGSMWISRYHFVDALVRLGRVLKRELSKKAVTMRTLFVPY